MTVPRPKLELVVDLYGSCLPVYDFMLRKIESERKWLRFSPRLHELTKNLKCENYPELYQDEARLQNALFRSFFETDDEIKAFLTELTTKSTEEQSQFFNDVINGTNELGKWVNDNFMHFDDIDLSPAAHAKARSELEKLSTEEQQRQIRVAQYSHAFALASFFNYLAVMVHGRKLTQLVIEALSGNDESYCLAVHIDKNIFYHIPYFKERHQSALEEGDQDFLEVVSKRLHSPQLSGRIRHRILYMLFSILDATQWLGELKHREILDICDQLQLDRYENRIETENALTKRLRDYRQFQKFNRMSMP